MSVLALLAPFAGKILGVLAGLLGAVGLYTVVRHQGSQAQQNADLKTTLKHVEAAHETSADVARMSDAAVDEQLRRQFSRPE